MTDIDTIVNVILTSDDLIWSKRVKNEAQVRQSIVIPLLRSLGWDDSNPEQVVPEYCIRSGSTVRGRVDLMLAVDEEPAVFIEIKKPGGVSSTAVEQVFGYVRYHNIPFVIVTDGSIWHFYIADAKAPIDERKFCVIDLGSPYNPFACAEFMSKYLGRRTISQPETYYNAACMWYQRRDLNRIEGTDYEFWIDILAKAGWKHRFNTSIGEREWKHDEKKWICATNIPNVEPGIRVDLAQRAPFGAYSMDEGLRKFNALVDNWPNITSMLDGHSDHQWSPLN